MVETIKASVVVGVLETARDVMATYEAMICELAEHVDLDALSENGRANVLETLIELATGGGGAAIMDTAVEGLTGDPYLALVKLGDS